MGTLLETREQAQKAVWTAQDHVRRMEASLADAQRLLRQAEARQAKTLPVRQADVAILEASLQQAQEDLKQAQEDLKQAEQALQAVREPRWEARIQMIRQTLDIPAQIAMDVDMRYGGGAQWKLQEMLLDEAGQPVMRTGVGRDGQPYSYPERRFGYTADVYGPEYESYRKEWKPAQVNWGTLGALEVEAAEDMLRIHILAVRLASYLNRVKEAWREEDQAD